MKQSLILATVLFLISLSTLQAQEQKSVYYYIDAINIYPDSGDEEEPIYFYSYPIHKTSDEKVNEDAILDEFKQLVKANYDVSKFASCVLRVNESYDEVMKLRERSLDKYKSKNYRIIRIDRSDYK